MKVFIYTYAFAPMVGGAETLVMLLAQGLEEHLTQKNKEKGELGVKKNVTVITPTKSNGFDDNTLPFRVVRQPSLWQLVKLIREGDIVHLAGPCFIPMILGLFLRKRIIIEHHGFQTVCPNGLLFYGPTQMPCPGHFMAGRHYECLRCNAEQGKLRSFKMWLLTFPRRWLCYHVSINVAITKWLAEVLRLPDTKVIYCGIPENIHSTVIEPSKLPLSLAFMGRLVSTKGVHILIQAIHRLKLMGFGFHLKIIGEGPERAALESQALTLRLSNDVEFTGYLPQKELEKALADVSVVVMPSLNGETFGLVAAENMMSGRVVVVSDIGVLSEVVGDAGLKFPPGDVEGLAQCLKTILENPQLLEEVGQRARKRAFQFFRQERMVDEHVSLYGGIL